MTKADVDAIRKRSKASGSGPWVTDYSEMGKKTVLRRMSKRWPLAPELAGAIDDEARAAIQQSVDGYYAMFTKAVARGRSVSISAVRDGMGQARCVSATDALAENMIDGVASFDDVIKSMQKNMRSGRAGANADIPPINRLAQAQRALQIAAA